MRRRGCGRGGSRARNTHTFQRTRSVKHKEISHLSKANIYLAFKRKYLKMILASLNNLRILDLLARSSVE